MITKKQLFIVSTLYFLAAGIVHPVFAQPVLTDSRIKTLVYNANDVYRLLTHHGYQAHIEFGEKEKIQTISVGDKIAWQVIPDGRRIFIRSLVSGAHTNLTVITNLHSYQFDIEATTGGKLPVREDLVYVVRFYYPDEYLPKSAAYTLPPVYADELMGATTPPENAPVQLPPLNFSYTFTGDEAVVPSRVFDDGSSTYFKVKPNVKIFTKNPQGDDAQIMTTPTSDGFLKTTMVRGQFMVRSDDGEAIIYNETYIGGSK
ncbi:MAG: hypothetical protein EAY65_07190 [Alphaproteobacteria bacterium]|nr:MAG: hypothetical protein EAY65_07190 [Alphaproteobacteria bacterium]